MQHEIIAPGLLLDEKGHLIQKGWARDCYLSYDRSAIRAPAWRIKEWDYYCVLSETEGISFTIADNGYLGFVAATVFDFTDETEQSNTVMTAFPLGKLKMPRSSKQGDVIFEHKSMTMRFLRRENERLLEIDWPAFQPGKDLKGTISLSIPKQDSMTIATPFAENPRAFYYNQKINCQPATGEIQFGERKLAFQPQSAFGVLDWGRGVWTYSNTWYWGSASGMLNGDPFGFNIGYGFGDTSAATENMIFYKGKAHKLDDVRFHIQEPDFMKPWRFSSNDGRFELDFIPIVDRFSNTNLLLLQSWQHQVFGRFTGKVVLDGGESLEVKNLLGFAEKVKNRW